MLNQNNNKSVDHIDGINGYKSKAVHGKSHYLSPLYKLLIVMI